MTTGHIGFAFSRQRQTPAPQRASSSALRLSNGSSAFNPGWGPHAHMSLSTQLFQNHGALFYSGGLAPEIQGFRKYWVKVILKRKCCGRNLVSRITALPFPCPVLPLIPASAGGAQALLQTVSPLPRKDEDRFRWRSGVWVVAPSRTHPPGEALRWTPAVSEEGAIPEGQFWGKRGPSH